MQKASSKEYLSEKDYKFIYSRVPRLCVDILLINGGKVLLTKRDIEPHKGRWHLPGGRVHMHESLDQALKRICKIELGVEAEMVKLVGFMEFLHDGEFVHSVSLVFLGKIISGEIQPASQSIEIKYWDKLPSDSHPEHEKFLETVNFSKLEV